MATPVLGEDEQIANPSVDNYKTESATTPVQYQQALQKKIYYDATIYSQDDTEKRIEDVREHCERKIERHKFSNKITTVPRLTSKISNRFMTKLKNGNMQMISCPRKMQFRLSIL